MVVILAGSLMTGIFLVGFRVGRERAFQRVTQAITGERPVEELENLGASQVDSQARYARRGMVVANGSGDLTVEDSQGERNQIVITPETRIHEKGLIVPKEEVQEGETVFILGQPSGQHVMRAKMVRVLSQPE
jgi:hypothetical protein